MAKTCDSSCKTLLDTKETQKYKIKTISSQILAAPGQKGASEAWSVSTNGPPAP